MVPLSGKGLSKARQAAEAGVRTPYFSKEGDFFVEEGFNRQH